MSGGSVYKNFSYYLSYSYENEGPDYYGEEGKYEFKLKDAYIQITSPFNLPLNIKFGQFKISDQIFKENLRLGESNYSIYDYYYEIHEYSNHINYDKGIQFHLKLPFDFNFLLGIYNGETYIPICLKRLSSSYPYFDMDQSKNSSYRIYKNFKDFRFGFFYFHSKQKWRCCCPDYGFIIKHIAEYLGPDFSFENDLFKIRLQYLKRIDDIYSTPKEPQLSEDARTEGGFIEILWFPFKERNKFSLGLLYNILKEYSPHGYNDLEWKKMSLSLNYSYSENIRVLYEIFYTWYGYHTFEKII